LVWVREPQEPPGFKLEVSVVSPNNTVCLGRFVGEFEGDCVGDLVVGGVGDNVGLAEGFEYAGEWLGDFVGCAVGFVGACEGCAPLGLDVGRPDVGDIVGRVGFNVSVNVGEIDGAAVGLLDGDE